MGMQCSDLAVSGCQAEQTTMMDRCLFAEMLRRIYERVGPDWASLINGGAGAQYPLTVPALQSLVLKSTAVAPASHCRLAEILGPVAGNLALTCIESSLAVHLADSIRVVVAAEP
jgi:hypothetical protein